MQELIQNDINTKHLVLRDGVPFLPQESDKKIVTIVDEDSFIEDDKDIKPLDFLNFMAHESTQSYSIKLKASYEKTGLYDAFCGGCAKIGGIPVVIGSLDFRFLGGSLGSVMGERIVRLCNRAIALHAPLILITASGGARMHEGLTSLMQMAKTSIAVNRLKQKNIPYITVLTHPTMGGVMASFAMQGDIVIGEPLSMIGFSGARVIRQTVKEELPEGFQTSEILLQQGMLDMIIDGSQMRKCLFDLVHMMTFHGRFNALEQLVPQESSPLDEVRHNIPETLDYKAVRSFRRPRTSDYISTLFTDFIELHGDRCFGDDPTIRAGMGFFRGIPVAVLGHEKGKTPKEMIRCNFGMPHPEGFRKAQRVMSLAEKFGLPVITLVDTPGAYPGVAAEERGQGEAISSSLDRMSALQVPIITINVGEGGSGGALALAMGNKVAMLRSSIYSVISPEGCASIIYRDASKANETAHALKIHATDCLELKLIDQILEDGISGHTVDFPYAAHNVGKYIETSLKELMPMSGKKIAEHRYERFLSIGVFNE